MAYQMNKEVEEKLLLLYAYDTLKIPVNPIDISEMMLKYKLMEYFAIAQHTSELIDSGMLERIIVDETEHFLITQNGKNTLSLFIERLEQDRCHTVDHHLSVLRKKLKRHRTINSKVEKLDDGTYYVTMKIMEGTYPLISLQLNTLTNASAQKMVERWDECATELYGEIIQKLS